MVKALGGNSFSYCPSYPVILSYVVQTRGITARTATAAPDKEITFSSCYRLISVLASVFPCNNNMAGRMCFALLDARMKCFSFWPTGSKPFTDCLTDFFFLSALNSQPPFCACSGHTGPQGHIQPFQGLVPPHNRQKGLFCTFPGSHRFRTDLGLISALSHLDI